MSYLPLGGVRLGEREREKNCFLNLSISATRILERITKREPTLLDSLRAIKSGFCISNIKGMCSLTCSLSLLKIFLKIVLDSN